MENQRGFTLVEVLIATVLTLLLVLGIAEISRETFKLNQNTITRGGSSEFVHSFSRWLNTSPGCNGTFQNQPLQLTAMPLTVHGFNMSETGNLVDLATGSQLNPQLQIKLITYQEKPGLTGAIYYKGLNLFQKVIQVNIQMQTLTQAKTEEIRESLFEIPVTVNSSNIVQFCNVELNPEHVCMASGAYWNDTTGECKQNNTCVIQGSYAQARSNPPSQCCEHYTSPWQNPVTGTDSCPSGSIPQKMGEKYYGNSRTYNCGKKCTANIDDWEDFYVCLKCP
jgi:prepilin-type N-terminal cleavage/methylation domain-containing protein